MAAFQGHRGTVTAWAVHAGSGKLHVPLPGFLVLHRPFTVSIRRPPEDPPPLTNLITAGNFPAITILIIVCLAVLTKGPQVAVFIADNQICPCFTTVAIAAVTPPKITPHRGIVFQENRRNATKQHRTAGASRPVLQGSDSLANLDLIVRVQRGVGGWWIHTIRATAIHKAVIKEDIQTILALAAYHRINAMSSHSDTIHAGLLT